MWKGSRRSSNSANLTDDHLHGVPRRAEDQGKAVSVPKGLTAIPLADCFAFEPTREAAEPTPDQVAVIMYTSGSTGKPKGVLLKHESVLASIAGLLDVLGKAATTGDCYLGYLPQSHILEFCAELTCLALGMHIGYADPEPTSTGLFGSDRTARSTRSPSGRARPARSRNLDRRSWPACPRSGTS